MGVSWLVLGYLKEWRWLFLHAAYSGFIYWLCALQYKGPVVTRSCLVPSTVLMVVLHMSLSRLPLISIDLYRTMVNPFLEFKKSMWEYDVGVFCYLVMALIIFVGVDREIYYRNKSSYAKSNCPIIFFSNSTDAIKLQTPENNCFSLAEAWVYGNPQIEQPKVCFVANRSTDAVFTSGRISLWLYPVVWLYLELAASTVATVLFSYFAFQRLVAGTSESIISRLRIIVVNFRNIFLQLSWILLIALLDILT